MKLLGGVFTYREEINVDVLKILNTEDSYSKDYWFEIIQAGMAGRIDLTSEFYQNAYVNKIKENEKMSKNKAWQTTEVHFKYDDNDDDDYRVNINNISDMKCDYESVDLKDEIRFALKDISDMNRALLINEGTNLKYILKSAIDGCTPAITKLRELCERFSQLSNSIEIVLRERVNIDNI